MRVVKLKYNPKYYQDKKKKNPNLSKEIYAKRKKKFEENPELRRQFNLKQKEWQRKYRDTYIRTTNKTFRNVNKRPYPMNECCEVCQKLNKKLRYHHWDDNNPHWGIWVCFYCHLLIEAIEKHSIFLDKYLKFKKKIEKTWN